MSESILSEPSPELLKSARRAQHDPELAATLARHCRELDAGALDTTIHPHCQMLGQSLRTHEDADLAVSQYFAVAMQQYQIVRQLIERLSDQPESIDFLDFACGYGRLLRFLVHGPATRRIYAAEIQGDAVDWVRDRYGIEAMLSHADPAAFEPGRRFDMIWAASLFSHLPDGLFGRWLGKLGSLLETGGLLCFSVHDEAILPEGLTMPESGMHYFEGSENADLDASIYGTAFVSEAYVAGTVRQHFGDEVTLRRLPRLLAHEQDVYVLARGERDLSSLDAFRRGTRGWLDELEIDRDASTLRLEGWAGSLDPVEFSGVEIRLGDRCVSQPTGEPREDVADILGYPGLAHSGFSCTLDLPEAVDPYLSISAVAVDGERALIYAGRLTDR